MAKDRRSITCNGRPAFYSAIYEDIRKCAIESGWAVALHGSLSSDMDIMAMPWTEEAVDFENLIKNISRLFDGNSLAENYSITYDEKPHKRVVATIPIWEDFYLDISTMTESDNKSNEAEWNKDSECSVCGCEAPNDGYWHSPYCPACGAKMYEREEE